MYVQVVVTVDDQETHAKGAGQAQEPHMARQNLALALQEWALSDRI